MNYTDERRAIDLATLVAALPRANWEDTSVPNAAQFTATLAGGQFLHVRETAGPVHYGWVAAMVCKHDGRSINGKVESRPGIALWRLLTELASMLPEIEAVIDAAAVEYRKAEV